MKNIKLAFICIVVVFMTSCSKEQANPPIEIQRLDLALQEHRVPDTMARAATVFLDMVNQRIDGYDTTKAVKAFAPLIKQRIHSLDSVQQALGKVYAYLNASLPKAYTGKTYGVILPYTQSIVFSDSSTFIGLNHYLGADCEAYAGFPEYRRKAKTLNRLPVDVAYAAIASSYPMQNDGMPSLLGRMLYEGAVVEALVRATGLTAEDVLGYDADQANWLSKNEAQAWKALVTREMLYGTEPSMVHAMVSPGPKTPVLHPEAPGQAGRWLGWRITNQYLKTHPNVTPDFLLSPYYYGNPTATLKAASYSPE